MARRISAMLLFGLALLAQTNAVPIAQIPSSDTGPQAPQQYPGSSSSSSAGRSPPTAVQLLAPHQSPGLAIPSSASPGSQTPTAAQLLAIQRQSSGSSASPKSSSPTAAQLLAQQSQDSKSPATPESDSSATGSSSSCAGGEIYTVQSGDTCETIARSKHVSTGTLVGLNKIGNECRGLQIGQKLCLPPPCMIHTVKSGETCSIIASALAKAMGKPYTVAIFRSVNP